MEKESKCKRIDYTPALEEMKLLLLSHTLMKNAIKVEFKIVIHSSCGCVEEYETESHRLDIGNLKKDGQDHGVN